MHLTTLTQWALICDCMLVYLYSQGSTEWDSNLRLLGFSLLMGWMLMSKFIKLMGHYIRYPGDLLLLPVSISFGYFHSLIIKVYAMLSLNVVSQPTPGHLWKNALRLGWESTILAPQMITRPGGDLRFASPLLMVCADSMGQSRRSRRRRCIPHETLTTRATRDSQ